MAADRSEARRIRRARRLRRRIGVGVLVCVVAAGGVVAWRLTRSTDASYRLATVGRADVAQTVDGDGAIQISDQASVAFATSGSVASVLAEAGQQVSAGQDLAKLDPTELAQAVTSATQQVSAAKGTLADDEAAQTSTTTTAAVVTGPGTSEPAIVLAAAQTRPTNQPTGQPTARPSARPSGQPSARPSATSGSGSGASLKQLVAAVSSAQQQVVAAVQTLDAAIQTEDSDIAAAGTACSADTDGAALTTSTTAAQTGSVTGSVSGQAAVVTLLDASGATDTTTTSTNPQQVAAGGQYSFAGLTAGDAYGVRIVSAAKLIDTQSCSDALARVRMDAASVGSADTALDRAVPGLTSAVQGLRTGATTSLPSASPSGSASRGGGQPTGARSGQPTGGRSGRPTGARSGQQSGARGAAPSGTRRSGGSGSRPTSSGGTGSGSRTSTNSADGSNDSNGSGSGGAGGRQGSSSANGRSAVVTAQQIVADQKSIDAANAALAVARRDRTLATLTSPMSGTVADVSISAGQSVSTSTTAMTIIGSNSKTVTLDVDIADIDLVKVGEQAKVTVDGRTAPIAGTVSDVGVLDASSGSTASYAVTVALSGSANAVRDGTGSSVAISVGTARGVLAVPLSAIHSVGTLRTVSVYSAGTVTITPVTLGVVGTDEAQIKSGLAEGQRVVLADIGAAVPTSTTDRVGGGLGGGLGGGGLGGGGLRGGGLGGGGGGGGRRNGSR